MAIGSRKSAAKVAPAKSAPAAPAAPAKRGPGRPVGSKNTAAPAAPAKRGPGRPVGSKNTAAPAAPAKRGPGRPAKNKKAKLVSNFVFDAAEMLAFPLSETASAVLNYTLVPGRDGQPDRPVVQITRVMEKDGASIATGLCPIPGEAFTGPDARENVEKICAWFRSFIE